MFKHLDNMTSLIRLLCFPNRKLYFDSTIRNQRYTKKRITEIINELNPFLAKLGIKVLINFFNN